MTAAFSALFAGIVAVGVTVAVERLGGRLGGVLGTAPTTIVPASLGFYAHSHDVEQFRIAIAIAPMGMVCNALFLWLWRVLPPHLPPTSLPRRLGMMTLLSLTGWAVAGSVGLTGMALAPSSWLPALGALLVLASAGFGAWACLAAPPSPSASVPVGPRTLFARGILAAVAVGLAVALIQIAGPLIAGLASVFPAIFLTTMVSLWWSQGEAVPAGAVGPMMLGSASVGAYAVFAAYALPRFGPAGAAIAWAAAVLLFTLPAAAWLRR